MIKTQSRSRNLTSFLAKQGICILMKLLSHTYPKKKNFTPADLEKLDKDAYKKWATLIFDLQYGETSYPFSWENVKEFGEFCAQSGGFEIC